MTTPLWWKCCDDCCYGDTGHHLDACEPMTTAPDRELLVGLVQTADTVRPSHMSVGGVTPTYVEVEVPRGYDEPSDPDV